MKIIKKNIRIVLLFSNNLKVHKLKKAADLQDNSNIVVNKLGEIKED
jgi:hypothetical protein